ncbi:DNA adenine methylase [Sulfurospirillum deleyianum]|uniref:site-specific DNA-methyltransferase (adenine-specific) n=1 Tax=Sulfurospirillum deleyianum (strain ATCC 51133 / DSM 6946 / 5175) TaxID=525898 RepID=D1B4X1_SULD5|nr:DNA adenine methylase [Sulfurospirillum deleyianum]ACZ13141.1 Site-specific DNA-methyltransferase (adenine- specific) [Sulfurospirillum deleyianum DSM 6946]
MNYIGSKAKLLAFLEHHILALINDTFEGKIVCDLFSGSGVVGSFFAQKGAVVLSNDREYYSYLLSKAQLQTGVLEGVEADFQALNALSPVQGWLYKHYSKSSGRSYFSDENAQKIDALRQGIEAYKEDEERYTYLLASLLHSADAVANTASVYSAFLKNLKSQACEPVCLKPLFYTPSFAAHQVFCEDANALISKLKGDILYLDPPYNRRQYGANYHLLNTIAHYDTFVPKGKTGLRAYASSRYCKATTALVALEEIVQKADFSYVVLSYNDEGLLSHESIEKMMKKYGNFSFVQIPHHRFKAYHNKARKSLIYEYLYLLKKA